MRRRILILGTLASVAACAGPNPETVRLVPLGGAAPTDAPPPREMAFPGLPAYEIHVFPNEYALYWTLPEGRARRYLVGIGRPGRYASGVFHVGDKREWPTWTPTRAMIEREPDLYAPHAAGMAGGPGNPLGARALYLYRADGSDSYLRIHGAQDSGGLGQRISNGCVRMSNSQVIQLYDEVPLGTRVVLHAL